MSFKSWQSYWIFARKIMQSHRYMHDQDTKDFFCEVLNTCQSRIEILHGGRVLWRSQLGGSVRTQKDDEGNVIGEEPCPHPRKRMYPREHMATEGRVNPKGIPCLYLATTKETAMSESRPWIGSEISVAQFKIIENLKIIDCSLNSSLTPLYFDVNEGLYEPNEEEREQSVWAHIDKAFSQPVTQNENQAHYAPTQIIAELFKSNGYDGVKYKSMLGSGYNVALFNIKSAELLQCFLCEVKNVSFEFGPITQRKAAWWQLRRNLSQRRDIETPKGSKNTKEKPLLR